VFAEGHKIRVLRFSQQQLARGGRDRTSLWAVLVTDGATENAGVENAGVDRRGENAGVG